MIKICNILYLFKIKIIKMSLTFVGSYFKGADSLNRIQILDTIIDPDIPYAFR